MKSLINKSLIVASAVIFCACVSTKQETKNIIPKWLENPNFNTSKLAAVGCAQIHYKGESAQKKLAVQRAIEKIAMQKNTKVSSLNYRKKFANSSGNKSSSSTTRSLHEVDKIDVSTKIKDYYKKTNGEICTWVIEN